MSTVPTPGDASAGSGRRTTLRVAAAAAAFLAAAAIAVYWGVTIGLATVSRYPAGTAVVEVLPLVVGAAAMVLLVVLVGLHFLDLPADRFARWRTPAALALAVAALPMILLYGFGVYAAASAVVLARRSRLSSQRSPAALIALVLGWVGVVVGALALLVAVGLCGPRILGGICDA